MNVTMFIVGFVIFAAYCYFLIWNIFYSSRKQKEENYPNLDATILGEKMKDFPVSDMPKPKRPKTNKKAKATKTKTKQNI